MTHYNRLNVKLLDSQLEKIKYATRSAAKVLLRLSLNKNGNGENNFPYTLFLTNRQITNLCEVLANYSSVDLKLSK